MTNSTKTLQAYEQLINMGFDEKVSMIVACKYEGNLNDCINYIQQTNNKKHNMDQVDVNYEWSWQSNKGNYIPYNVTDCNAIEKLPQNKSHFIFANGTQYEIKKISTNQCQQINIRTNKSRNVIRQTRDSDIDDNNATSEIQRHKLHNTTYMQYPTIKLKNTHCAHNKIETNKMDEYKQHRSAEKWFWQTDNGEYKQLNNNLSHNLTHLSVGHSIKTKINNSMYEVKKTAMDRGQQRNIQTNKCRNIRTAKYKWFYQDNDKSFKPFTDHLSQQITKCQIGSSFIFSLKSGVKYQITKTSNNNGKQKNLITKFERIIVYKMTRDSGSNNQDIIDKLDYTYSHSISKDKLVVGDHIYCWRTLYLYQHHGIYIGNGQVIHFIGEIVDTKNSIIKQTTLDRFLKGDTLKRVEYGVSKKYFTVCRAGSCNISQKDDNKLIVSRAKSALGWGKGHYNVMTMNCETFCLWCTLGKRYKNSNQSAAVAINAAGGAGFVAGAMIFGPVGAVVGGVASAVLQTTVIAKSDEKKRKHYKQLQPKV